MNSFPPLLTAIARRHITRICEAPAGRGGTGGASLQMGKVSEALEQVRPRVRGGKNAGPPCQRLGTPHPGSHRASGWIEHIGKR
jgi:hypothetical protein